MLNFLILIIGYKENLVLRKETRKYLGNKGPNGFNSLLNVSEQKELCAVLYIYTEKDIIRKAVSQMLTIGKSE